MNFVELAERNLSNNFNGKEREMNVLSATANAFGVNIVNSGTTPVNIALIPGHYPVLGMTSGTTPSLHYHNLFELNNVGHMVQAVLDDGDQTVTGGGVVTCSSTDPTYTVRSFLEYIKTFNMALAQIDLRSPTGNVQVYDNKIKFTRTNPFFRAEEVPVRTSRFFSPNQYQDNRIEISMIGTEAVLAKDLLVVLTIPPNSTVGVDMYFTN